MDPVPYLFRVTISVVCALILAACSGHAMSSNPDTPVSSMDRMETESRRGEGISGRVTDAAGRPVAGASILAESVDHPPVPIPEILIVTNADGGYLWSSLFPGRYRLTVIAKGYRPVTLPSQMKRGELSILNFVLK